MKICNQINGFGLAGWDGNVSLETFGNSAYQFYKSDSVQKSMDVVTDILSYCPWIGSLIDVTQLGKDVIATINSGESKDFSVSNIIDAAVNVISSYVGHKTGMTGKVVSSFIDAASNYVSGITESNLETYKNKDDEDVISQRDIVMVV